MDSKNQESGSSLLQRQIEEVRSMIAGMQAHLKFLEGLGKVIGTSEAAPSVGEITRKYEKGRLKDHIIPFLVEHGPSYPDDIYKEIAKGRSKLRNRKGNYGPGMIEQSLSMLLLEESPRIKKLEDGRYDVVR